MARKGERVEPVIVEEPIAETIIETPAEAPSQEQLMEALRVELKDREDKLTLAESSLQGLRASQKERERKLKELEGKLVQPSRPSQLHASEVLLEELEAREKELGEPNPRIARLKAEIVRERQSETQAAQVQWQEQEIQRQQEKFNQQIKEAGLDPQDERLEDFQDAFEDAKDDGKFGKAERKLNRILSKVKPSEPKGKEVERDMKDEWIEEGRRQAKEELGLLTSQTGGPSGAGMSDNEFEHKFGSGELDSTPANLKRAKDIMDKRLKGG